MALKFLFFLLELEVKGMQNLEPFISTIIPKNGRVCFPICGDTEGTLSSTLCKFRMYFISTLYSLNLLLIVPPKTQEAMQMHSLLVVSVATENSHIGST